VIKTAQITLTINGEKHIEDVPVRMNLADFIRTKIGLTGTHVGCEHGVCGACTLFLDGVTIRSCLTLAVQADGSEITTIEGYETDKNASDLIKNFYTRNALQCGYCTPGMLASSIEYIEQGNPADRELVKQHISGNYCRCTGYQAIVDAICTTIEERQN
jgi:carbon-monoxide dehydrogenase small subunit